MRFVFVGDRFFVLKEMLKQNCEVSEIFMQKGSYGEVELKKEGIDYRYIGSKAELVQELGKLDFDCLVSNGCPYILPVSQLKKDGQIFINIHPSLLPDLKGVHPINGALLHNRSHGVTCHHMDDAIDAGAIITSIEIPVTADLDLGLLYQISFQAEGKVFERAMARGFRNRQNKRLIDKPVYYTRRPEDLLLTKEDSLGLVMRKIRAFGIPEQCARYRRENQDYKILSAAIIDNPAFYTIYDSAVNDEIVAQYDTSYLVKIGECFVKFILLETAGFQVGERFFNFDLSNFNNPNPEKRF